MQNIFFWTIWICRNLYTKFIEVADCTNIAALRDMCACCASCDTILLTYNYKIYPFFHLRRSAATLFILCFAQVAGFLFFIFLVNSPLRDLSRSAAILHIAHFAHVAGFLFFNFSIKIFHCATCAAAPQICALCILRKLQDFYFSIFQLKFSIVRLAPQHRALRILRELRESFF